LLLYSQNPAIGPHQVFSYFQFSLVKFLYAFLISHMCGLHAFWLILVFFIIIIIIIIIIYCNWVFTRWQ
jgi:hypothetical protein